MPHNSLPISFTKTVIVVDDQSEVLDTTLALLKHLCRQQLDDNLIIFYSTSNAEEALRLVQQHPTALLVSDVDLSHQEINGITLARAASQSRVILVSGNLEEHRQEIDELMLQRAVGGCRVLAMAKPFGLSALRDLLQALTK